MATLLFVIWHRVTGLQETGLQSEHTQGKNTKAHQQEGGWVLEVCGQSKQLQTNSQTLWFAAIIFQVLAITWHTSQTFCLPNSREKTAAAASVAFYWGDGWTPHGGPEATHKKSQFHETDSSRLHPPSGSCWWQRPLHLGSSSLGHQAGFTTHQTGGHMPATSYDKWHRAGQAFLRNGSETW